jgi:hypothetical protein
VRGLGDSLYGRSETIEMLRRLRRIDELPGLEAMSTTSALTRIVNRPGVKVASDLSIVAATADATGIMQPFADRGLDFWFGQPNDIAVATDSMYGGATREGGAWHARFDGTDVTHFSYFRTPTIARAIVGRFSADSPRPPWRLLGPGSPGA